MATARRKPKVKAKARANVRQSGKFNTKALKKVGYKYKTRNRSR